MKEVKRAGKEVEEPVKRQRHPSSGRGAGRRGQGPGSGRGGGRDGRGESSAVGINGVVGGVSFSAGGVVAARTAGLCTGVSIVPALSCRMKNCRQERNITLSQHMNATRNLPEFEEGCTSGGRQGRHSQGGDFGQKS